MIEFLHKENDLNKILHNQKLTKEPIALLFISYWEFKTFIWDEISRKLFEYLKKYNKLWFNYPLYIINSYEMPHSFVIFKTTRVPQLVLLNVDKTEPIKIINHTPEIFDFLFNPDHYYYLTCS